MDREMASAVSLNCHLEITDIEPLDTRLQLLSSALRADESRTFAACIAYIEQVCPDGESEIDWTISTLVNDHLGLDLVRIDPATFSHEDRVMPPTVWTGVDATSNRDVVAMKQPGLIFFNDNSIVDGVIYNLYGRRR